MIRHTLIAAALVVVSYCAQSVELHTPYDPEHPPSSVTASGLPHVLEVLHASATYPYHCVVTLRLSRTTSEMGPGYGAGYRQFIPGAVTVGSDRTTVCNGVTMVRRSPDVVAQINAFVSTLEYTPLTYVGDLPMQTGTACEFDVHIGFGNGVGLLSRAIPCDVSMPPVRCEIKSLGDIDHGTQSLGTISSTRVGRMTLSCSRASTVTLRTYEDTIHLGSGKSELRSKIYIGHTGSNTWTGTVSQDTPVEIISVLNDNAVVGGEYSGSAVVTANWE